jgi:hypothetical protein
MGEPSRSGRGPVAHAVASTLDALDLPASDRGIAALTIAYAAEIDAAAERGEHFDRLLRKLSRQYEPDIYDALVTAHGLLGVRATLDKLGGRLQTGLDSLRATPRARPVAPPRAPVGSPLGRLRAVAGTDVEG